MNQGRIVLHQDKDEHDFTQPIVSVSLGLPATFLFGGLSRANKTIRISLVHGDVVAWADLRGCAITGSPTPAR